jgi:coenzyme F420-reducing hydrogenase delta subunit
VGFFEKVSEFLSIFGVSHDDIAFNFISVEEVDRVSGDVHEEVGKIYSIVNR